MWKESEMKLSVVSLNSSDFGYILQQNFMESWCLVKNSEETAYFEASKAQKVVAF